ncbi:MAG TPA: hypothetical protein VIL74_02360 [Pyrinomonadaceae bacterium]|jgi:hypothetical protein
MRKEVNKQKQDADEDRAPESVERDGFTAEELGEASSYDATTEMSQMMRRGDETEGDPDNRDVVGASNAANTDNQPVPRHQNAKSDLIRDKGTG